MSDEALAQMVHLILEDVPGVAGLREFHLSKESHGVRFDLRLSLYYGFSAQEVLREAQQAVGRLVEELTSINVLEVDLRAVHLEQHRQAAQPYASLIS